MSRLNSILSDSLSDSSGSVLSLKPPVTRNANPAKTFLLVGNGLIAVSLSSSSFVTICLRGELRVTGPGSSLEDFRGDFEAYEADNPLLTCRRLPVWAVCSSELVSLSTPILCPARLSWALALWLADLWVDLGVTSLSFEALPFGLARGKGFLPRLLSPLELLLVSLELVSNVVSLPAALPDLVTLGVLKSLLPVLSSFLNLKLWAPILTLEPLVTFTELSLDKMAAACCSDKITLLRGNLLIAPLRVWIS